MPQNQKIKVVLADDEEFITKAYKEGFERAGYEVYTASDGEQALALINSQNPDIILLDLIMPKKTGFDVLKEIKANQTLATKPVAILTNLSQDADENEAKSLGAADFIIKSNCSLKEVIERVQRLHGGGPQTIETSSQATI